MKQVEGGVCAAAGFSANGLNCGLNPDKNKNDLALIWSEKECTAAAVYTTNKVKGAPILVTKKHLAATGNKARAVIVNSKNANTCNADGEEKAQMMCDLAGKTLAAASSLGLTEKVAKKEQAAKVGEMIAKKAQEAGITTVVFDRNGYLYHGRVKEVADAARNGGLKF